MIERIIFQVPVYYRAKEEFQVDYEKDQEKFIAYMRENAKKVGIKYTKEDRERDAIRHDAWSFLCWKYNDIIAWIDIYIEDMHLQADLYKIKAKRVTTRTIKREYRYIYKLSKICDIEDHSNKEIAHKIKGFLSDLDLTDYFPKYFIDTECVFNIIDFINFKKLKDSTLKEDKG